MLSQKALGPFETSGTTYPTTQHRIQPDITIKNVIFV
jgi:hypothetical protein